MRDLVKRHPLVSFFGLTFVITWGLEAVRLLLGLPGVPAIIFLEVAGAGPSLAGLTVAWIAGGGQGVRKVLGRILRWRVEFRWYLLVLIFFPALLVAVIAAATVLSGEPFSLAFPGPWWLLPAFMPLVLFLGPLQEELGWRAFALPALMERHGWLPAGLLLGVAWALWHRTPLTWTAISWSEPLGSTGLLGLTLGAVIPDIALSVLMAWVYWRTQGSALLAGLGMHTAANYALFLPAVPTGPAATMTTWVITASFAGCLALLALLVALTQRKAGAPPPR